MPDYEVEVTFVCGGFVPGVGPSEADLLTADDLGIEMVTSDALVGFDVVGEIEGFDTEFESRHPFSVPAEPDDMAADTTAGANPAPEVPEERDESDDLVFDDGLESGGTAFEVEGVGRIVVNAPSPDDVTAELVASVLPQVFFADGLEFGAVTVSAST